jgi:hypothetical protein
MIYSLYSRLETWLRKILDREYEFQPVDLKHIDTTLTEVVASLLQMSKLNCGSTAAIDRAKKIPARACKATLPAEPLWEEIESNLET